MVCYCKDCYAWLAVFGRKHSIKENDIESVTIIQIKFLPQFIIPMGRGGKNLRLTLKNGRKIYINAATSDFDDLVKHLEESSVGRQS